jgi:predicted transcriptional regulator
MEQTHEHLLSLAAKIVSAHIGNHMTTAEALPALIRDVYRTLAEVEPELAAIPRGATPGMSSTAPARQAVAHDHLTCLECGLTMKMLKRHLITVHGLTPDDYRSKWSLSADHPMVTSEYAKLRSSLAKQSGLGKRPEAKPKSAMRRGRSGAGSRV